MIGYSFVLMHRKLAKNKKLRSNVEPFVVSNFFLVPVFNNSLALSHSTVLFKMDVHNFTLDYFTLRSLEREHGELRFFFGCRMLLMKKVVFGILD
jgi:hypothetical protein